MPLKMLIILAVVALVAVSFGLAEPALASSGGAACPGSRRFSRFSSPSGRVAKFFGGRSHAVTGCIFMLC